MLFAPRDQKAPQEVDPLAHNPNSAYFVYRLFSQRRAFLISLNNHTQGKVHNPTGAGVRAVSSGVQRKAASVAAAGKNENGNGNSSNGNKTPHHPVSHSHGSRPGPHRHHHHITDDELATHVKEGTAKRNITRKKTDPAVGGNYDSKSKKMGGAG